MTEPAGGARPHWPAPSERVSESVRRRLSALTSDLPTLDDFARKAGRRISVDGRFQPQLLHMVLEDILVFRNLGRSDKTAWEFCFGYRGALCVTAFRKYGLTLEAYAMGASEEELDALLLKLVDLLTDAARLVERHVFQDFITDQIKVGAVGVRNQSSHLRAMYMYFRELTEAAHSGAGQLTNLPSSRGAWLLPAQTEGFYNTVAMVNAYFSYLEHLFVLMLPFSDFDRSKDDLVSFIKSKWGEKYKRIIPLKESQEAERFYNRLRAIAEEFRNAHVHGGFNKSHGGLIVHCSGGALYADMATQRGKPYYELVPVGEGDFEHVCATFDEFDSWLASKCGHRWATASLNVAFDEASIATYTASASDAEFQTLLEQTADLEDRYANMDW